MLRVLFICTGNFYRSRYAEALFNHLAQEKGQEWQAVSRGLATHLAQGGLVAMEVVDQLERDGIDLIHLAETKTPITEPDFEQCDRLIAMNEKEHRREIENRFPRHASRVEYWDIVDVGDAPSTEELPRLAKRVHQLIEEL